MIGEKFPTGRRPWFSPTKGRVATFNARQESIEFDALLLRRYLSEPDLTLRQLGQAYCLSTSTIRDRINNARKRKKDR